MKKLFLSIATLVVSIQGFAQIGATAPNFNVTDINGNTIRLYEDILDLGLIAVVDVSATWCGPCWSLHQSNALKQLHEQYGPNGSNQLRVIFYEGDANTGMNALQGTGGNTQGDWITGTPFPIVNESPLTLNLNIWAPEGFPTVNIVNPSDKKIVADTWNLLSLSGQVNAISSATGINLITVGLSDITSSSNAIAYPNPSNTIMNVNLVEFNNAQVTIEIYNLQGALVMSQIANNNIEVLDISNLANGNYMLRAYNNDKVMNQLISVVH